MNTKPDTTIDTSELQLFNNNLRRLSEELLFTKAMITNLRTRLVGPRVYDEEALISDNESKSNNYVLLYEMQDNLRILYQIRKELTDEVDILIQII
jgi:hypothetical protein